MEVEKYNMGKNIATRLFNNTGCNGFSQKKWKNKF